MWLVFSILIKFTKITSAPKLVRIDTSSLPKLSEADLSIVWTGGQFEFDHSHHLKAESKVSPK